MWERPQRRAYRGTRNAANEVGEAGLSKAPPTLDYSIIPAIDRNLRPGGLGKGRAA
jgi:hypothetical protein